MSHLNLGKLVPTCVFLGASLAASLVTTRASAQEWLKDRRFNEGAGIRAGDLELHPGLAGEFGYDSNFFLRSHKSAPNVVNAAPNTPVKETFLMRITPSLSLSTLGAQRKEGQTAPPPITFRTGLSATYREFFGDEELQKQRNVSGNANARVDILPNRPLGAALFGGYTRTIQPNVLGNPDLAFNRNDINGGAELIAMPGGGTFDVRAGYQFFGTFFESTAGTPYTTYQHEFSGRTRWKFRPRTALFHDTTLRVVAYPNRDRAINLLNESTPLRTRLGLNGLVTSRLAVLAAAGYGATFFRGPAATTRQFDSLIGQAQLTFFLTGNPDASAAQDLSLSVSTLALGYQRDFQNSYLGNYMGTDRGYAKLAYFFAGRALVSLEGGLTAMQYPDIFRNIGGVATQVATPFTVLSADATLFGEYRFSEVFGMNLTGKYEESFTDTRILAARTTDATGTSRDVFFDLSWRRIQAFVGARLFW